MNYLEHEDKVKYIDGLLAREQEWQWFVECIEKSFNLIDVNSWNEYLSISQEIRDVYSYFVKVVEICGKEWNVESEVLKEIILVSKYYWGIVDTDYCIASLKSNVGRLLFLIIWITKLENQDNQTTYILDMRFFIQENMWEIINVNTMDLYLDKIEMFFSSLDIEGMDIAKKCVLDNINKVKYLVSKKFIDEYREKFLSVNAISYHCYNKDENMTWQEEYILQMLQVSISDRTLKPLIILGDTVSPDSKLWGKEIIKNMKEYFSDESANFILETIAYIEHNMEPSSTIKLMHCRLLAEFVSIAKNRNEIIECSSYRVISYMFEDKMFSEISKEADYIALIKAMQNISEPHIIKHLQEDKYPLSKNQKNILNDYYNSLASQIDTIEDVNTFISYIEKKDVVKRMNTNNFNKVCKFFYKCIENKERDMIVATLFYQYMLFLININSFATEVDNRKVRLEIIHVQQVWQDNYYSEQVNNLHLFTYETKIATKDVDNYNAALLINPIFVAKNCMIPQEEQMCKVMEDASQNALVHMFATMSLSPLYPIKGEIINFERHDIDIFLRQTVEKIRQEKSYKFLNILDIDTYVSAIHKRYRELAEITVAMFNEEEKVYQLLQQEADYKLLPYDKNILLAHLTQLFPLLEKKIRQLASLVGIVPFKERIEDFMIYKDSSSVLRELLLEVHKETGNFGNVPDLLFVYHFMYNSNSLNIRNECIHGRDYMDGSRLRFAFRLTLLAIYMIVYRINVINLNMSKESNEDKI